MNSVACRTQDPSFPEQHYIIMRSIMLSISQVGGLDAAAKWLLLKSSVLFCFESIVRWTLKHLFGSVVF